MRICEKCCMDESDPDIIFDEKGICNHCYQAQKSLKEIKRDIIKRPWVIYEIKKSGEGKKYDCLIGLSGGVDSSLTLHYAIEQGLRPLAYQVDNGWNTPESDENVMRMVEGLKVPFYRYTINLERFRALQGAFLASNTLNIEIPTDHILMATTYEMASKYGIKYVLSGGNVATESIMPASWGYQPRDLRFIRSVYKKHTGSKLKDLPLCGIIKYNWYLNWKRIKVVYLLDYYNYNLEQAKKLLSEKYGWKPYGEKHEESKFTKWFQKEYLPQFGIDKRKAHYSSLINSGQMTREEALEKLKGKVLGNKVIVSYKNYPNNEYWFNLISKIVRKWRF